MLIRSLAENPMRNNANALNIKTGGMVKQLLGIKKYAHWHH